MPQSKIKIFYAINARIPTEKAHGIQTMKTCEALSEFGADVTLIIPRRFNEIKESPYEYYGVKNNFKIKKLPVLDLFFWDSSFSFLIKTFSFAVACFFYFLFKRNYVLYARGEIILPLAKLPTGNIFWEAHIKTENFSIYKRVIKKVKGLIVVNKHFKNELIRDYDLMEEKVLWAPDGVDLDKFNIKTSKEEARKHLDLPNAKKIILSSTSFLLWKGADIFLKSAHLLPEGCFILLFKSGEKKHVEEFIAEKEKNGIKNILILEKQPYEKIPLFLKSADILVLNGTNKSDISKYYTSPLKMFEYMASQRPILSADVISFREILNDGSAVFYESDNAADFAAKIHFIFNNYPTCEKKAIMAFNNSLEFTWKKRAEAIIKFINKKIKSVN
ncbi:MAG: Glycosyl transferase group 1 [Candidatus Magasanikbacteria bacterium GW2011_GWA2_42_32]|uniref:Glycosyl transferase group 1 n=1 Tax=Candidatus Magasanikbacteria bacterium GW2011_GWA2_42_32 TaxID=1619039 RepID=A0A0G1A6M7_9BACT|nr:MAG: Glycosyl transferase group 1 [Candidatus Magasanikbacteria bacterium GW2011_GWA2_42_32]